MAQSPLVTRFTYVLIPADIDSDLSLRTFAGGDDDTLRSELARYFQGTGMTAGQKSELHESITEKVSKSGGATTHVEAMLSDNTTKFEIVPVVMPKKVNGFIGTSLYIDEVGRFKELALNDRASRVAQRDIRGDAFILSNHDDPAADTWERVDCSVEYAQHLILAPPPCVPDPMKVAPASHSEQVILSQETVERAAEIKKDANEMFGMRRFREASAAYSQALETIDGRSDNVDGAAVDELRMSLLLNRAQCSLRLGLFESAVIDATAVLAIRIHTKAMYVRCSANLHLKDFEACRADIDAALRLVPGNTEFLLLKDNVEGVAVSVKAEEKKRFQRLFD